MGLACIGAAAGPFVGGLVTEHLGWRFIFYLNVPVAAAALALGAGTVRDSRDESASRHIDLAGLLAVGAGVVLLVLAIDRAPDWGWTAPGTLGAAASGLVLLAGFVQIEARVKAPLVELALLRIAPSPGWAASARCPMRTGASWSSAPRSTSTRSAASRSSRRACCSAAVGRRGLGGPLSGRLAGHIAPGHLMATGMLVAAGAVGVMTLSHAWPVWIPALGIARIGLGLAYATTNAGTLAAVPASKAGAASGIVLTGLLIAAAFAVTLAASLVEALRRRGPGAEGLAVDAVLRIGAAASAADALLLLADCG